MKSNLLKSFSRLKTASLYGIGKHLGTISQLLISYFIIKKHSDILWGEYVELLIWVNLIALFSYFGNKSFLLKSFSENPSKIYQSWLTNFNGRILLFLVSTIAIFFVPLFQENRILILLWLFTLFYNQSFETLILYQKDFKFSIYAELAGATFIVLGVFFFIENMDLGLLLILVNLGGLIKALCYSVFYFSKLKGLEMRVDHTMTVRSLPFFIPMILGTFRSKIDAYYGTVFFSKSELSHYQIFVSMITLVQLGTAYIVNPYLKNLYRVKSTILNKIQRQSIWGGIFTALLFLPVLFVVTQYIYGFTFTAYSYSMAVIFISTLFLHLLLINEFYKQDQQYTVAVIVAIIAVLQIVLGYYIIPEYHTEGALTVKLLGQLASVAALLLLKKNRWKNV